MKNKKLNSFILVLSSLVITSLVSCGINDTTSSLVDESSDTTDDLTSEETTNELTPSSTEESSIIRERDDIFISEILVNGLYNGYIEIANATGKDVDLTGYKLNIYRYGNIDTEVDFSEKIIKNGRVFVISNASATGYLGDVIKLESDPITGKNYLELIKDNEVIDSVGTKGFNLSYISEGSLVRFGEFFKAYLDYDYLHFASVRSEIYDYLGNLDVVTTQEKYLEGPKINEIYSSYAFEENQIPEGGFIEGHVTSLGDGDTTFFRELDNSVRYLMINCPEVYHAGKEGSYDEPWAQTAKKFNNTVLRNAKKILIQSNKGYSLHETYGRYLGYIWYSDKNNPNLDDYKLLNYEMVLNGLARLGSHNYNSMYSKDDVYYGEYMVYAQKYATSIEKGVFGPVGNDPDYDYENSSYIGD